MSLLLAGCSGSGTVPGPTFTLTTTAPAPSQEPRRISLVLDPVEGTDAFGSQFLAFLQDDDVAGERDYDLAEQEAAVTGQIDLTDTA